MCILVISGITLFLIVRNSDYLQKNIINNSNIKDESDYNLESKDENHENTEDLHIADESASELKIVNSEKDLKYPLLKLKSEADVEEFNEKLKKVYIERNFNFFMMNTVAQELQGFSTESQEFANGKIHISIKKDFFNERIAEIFGKENAKKFKFKTKPLYVVANDEKELEVYEQDGYYIFDYTLDPSIGDHLEYRNKKTDKDMIQYEYIYDPEFMIPYVNKWITFDEILVEYENIPIKEKPILTITYKKEGESYKISSIEGIERLYEFKVMLNEFYGASL